MIEKLKQGINKLADYSFEVRVTVYNAPAKMTALMPIWVT